MAWDRTSIGKYWGKKRDKRGQVHVYRWLLTTVVQPCPAPDHSSSSYLLIKLQVVAIFLGEGNLCSACVTAWMRACQHLQLYRGSLRPGSRGHRQAERLEPTQAAWVPVSVWDCWQTPSRTSLQVGKRLGSQELEQTQLWARYWRDQKV